MNLKYFVPIALGVLSLTGCATLSIGGPSGPSPEVVDRVLQTGRSLLGNQPDAKVEVNGRTFILDCIGTVSAAWWGAGIDIQRDFRRYRGNGVHRLYESLRSWGALHWQRTPAPGDIVIWDNTWDYGSDPNYPEGHTHAGIVLSVASDGTVEYLHESVTRGVVISYMNLYDPSATVVGKRVLNSPMYLGSGYGRASNPPLWTSGQLWSAFGDGLAIARVLEGS